MVGDEGSLLPSSNTKGRCSVDHCFQGDLFNPLIQGEGEVSRHELFA